MPNGLQLQRRGGYDLKAVIGAQDEAQTKEQTYDADSKIEGEDENNTNDKGEERQNQDSGTWTISPCTHCLLPKWTCVPYWDGPRTFQLLIFYLD